MKIQDLNVLDLHLEVMGNGIEINCYFIRLTPTGTKPISMADFLPDDEEFERMHEVFPFDSTSIFGL